MSGQYKKSPHRGEKGCFIFLLDHSFSMTDPSSGSHRSKSEVLATAINRLINEVIMKCEKGEEEPRDYFDIGVIAYTTDQQNTPIIGPALQGDLAGADLVGIPELYNNPLSVETRTRKVDDGQGGLIEIEFNFPIWYQAPSKDQMAGTPMCAALEYVHRVASDWCAANPSSFPPVVIHLTDGEPADGDPEPASAALRALATDDGNVLLFNCHLSSADVEGLLFPTAEGQIPDEYGKLLFRISSVLPESLRTMAEAQGLHAAPGSRGMAFNADSATMIALINVGTIVVRNELI